MDTSSKKPGRNRLERNDRLVRMALLVVAFSAVSVLVVITVFIVGQGTPIMVKYGLKSFLAGSNWTVGSALSVIVFSALLVLAAIFARMGKEAEYA